MTLLLGSASYSKQKWTNFCHIDIEIALHRQFKEHNLPMKTCILQIFTLAGVKNDQQTIRPKINLTVESGKENSPCVCPSSNMESKIEF